MKTKINAFGFEIEGIFDSDSVNKFRTCGKIKGDGSVHGCDNLSGGNHNCKWCNNHAYQACEYNTGVIPYTKAGAKEANDILKLFNTEYEAGNFHFNKSTGFHIHLSFNPKVPKEILSIQYHDFMVKRITIKYMSLLEKNNRIGNTYCKEYKGSRKDICREIWRGSERYRNINFQPALQRHGTIEFRWFPTCEPRIMADILKDILKWTDQFIKKGIEEKLEFNITMTPKSFMVKDIINNKKSSANISNRVRMKPQEYPF